MLGVYHYRNAIAAVDPGAVNVSGLAHWLVNALLDIEEELEEEDEAVTATMLDLRNACLGSNANNTYDRNTDGNVVAHVEALANMAFITKDMCRVASHPIIRLVVSQMAQLSGVLIEDPLYLERWREAYDEAKEVVEQAERVK